MSPFSHGAKASPYSDDKTSHTLLTLPPIIPLTSFSPSLALPQPPCPPLLCFRRTGVFPFQGLRACSSFCITQIPTHPALSPFMSSNKIQLLSNHFLLPYTLYRLCFVCFVFLHSTIVLSLFKIVDIFCILSRGFDLFLCLRYLEHLKAMLGTVQDWMDGWWMNEKVILLPPYMHF